MELTSTKNHIKIRFRSCFSDRNMIGAFESKFLLVTIICSVPIHGKIIITRCSLGSKLNTIRARMPILDSCLSLNPALVNESRYSGLTQA